MGTELPRRVLGTYGFSPTPVEPLPHEFVARLAEAVSELSVGQLESPLRCAGLCSLRSSVCNGICPEFIARQRVCWRW